MGRQLVYIQTDSGPVNSYTGLDQVNVLELLPHLVIFSYVDHDPRFTSDIPVCGRQGQGIGVGREEEARVVCHADGNPPPTEFL